MCWISVIFCFLFLTRACHLQIFSGSSKKSPKLYSQTKIEKPNPEHHKSKIQVLGFFSQPNWDLQILLSTLLVLLFLPHTFQWGVRGKVHGGSESVNKDRNKEWFCFETLWWDTQKQFNARLMEWQMKGGNVITVSEKIIVVGKDVQDHQAQPSTSTTMFTVTES